MPDPFLPAARRIIAKIGDACTLTRDANAQQVSTIAVLDRDVEVFDELGNVIERADMISLLVDDVGTPKSKDVVAFTGGDTYRLGRTVNSDGYVVRMMARRQ